MAAAAPKGKRCRYCGRYVEHYGQHLYDCPVVQDKGTDAPGNGRWWE